LGAYHALCVALVSGVLVQLLQIEHDRAKNPSGCRQTMTVGLLRKKRHLVARATYLHAVIKSTKKSQFLLSSFIIWANYFAIHVEKV